MAVTSELDRVTDDLARLRVLFVNLYFVGSRESWVLVDAGLQGCRAQIIETAEELFGPGAKPRAIVLTHGHFDHIGALPELFEDWDVPVHAHPLEMPFLTGRSDYPPPDPTVGTGAMALMSFTFPNKGVDLGQRVEPLRDDGGVPFMPDWRWVHAPGHTPGQVALWRERDRCLVSADAFVTCRQESLYAVLTQMEEVNGPPSYFTPDWIAARETVERLAALKPAIAASGHGRPMRGEELRSGLERLAAEFDEVAVPSQGRYVPEELKRPSS